MHMSVFMEFSKWIHGSEEEAQHTWHTPPRSDNAQQTAIIWSHLELPRTLVVQSHWPLTSSTPLIMTSLVWENKAPFSTFCGFLCEFEPHFTLFLCKYVTAVDWSICTTKCLSQNGSEWKHNHLNAFICIISVNMAKKLWNHITIILSRTKSAGSPL